MELLLDTICNMFGSIILIALLIVVISSDTPSPSRAVSQMDHDTVQQRIRTAESNILKLTELLNQSNQTEAMDEKITRNEELSAAVDAAKRAIQSAKKQGEESSTAATVDYSASVSAARAAATHNDRESNRIQNEIESSKKQIEKTSAQISDLEKRIGQIQDNRTQKIRLPRERSTARKSLPVVFIYNEVFLSGFFDSGGDFEVNDAGIERVEINENAERWIPRKTKGVSEAGVESSLRNFPSEFYAACYVFPDSIEAFRKFRDAAARLKVDVGWEPSLDPKDLIFTSKGGSAPKPQ